MLPTGNDFALIANGGTATISTLTPTCGTLALGYGGNGNASMSDGRITVKWYEYVGNSGAGNFSQSGGTNSSLFLVLGFNVGSTGVYTLSGTGQLSASETIGDYGSGAFSQTGGTNSSGFLSLGYYGGSNGTYNLMSGLVSAQNEVVGLYGPGIFNQSSGTNALEISQLVLS